MISFVVAQHLEEAIALREARSRLVRAPQAGLLQLARADERLAAHLDGLLVAGEAGSRLAETALSEPTAGPVFVAAVLALESRNRPQLDALVERMTDSPHAARGMASAMGWVSAAALRGLSVALLTAPSPSQRWLGLAACSAHRADPGALLTASIEHADVSLRSQALHLAGELGRVDLLPACLRHLADPEPEARWAAARAAVLLGDRGKAHQSLHSMALDGAGEHADAALALALCSADAASARQLVHELAERQAPLRRLIRAAAWTGDIRVVPWLLQHMADERLARCAGEAFCTLTGMDLTQHGLERPAPETVDATPTEDPTDANVAPDPDEGLPWPAVEALAEGWRQRQAATPAWPARCLLGRSPDPAQCQAVLKQGSQRQRQLAALHLKLQGPAAPLFNTAAPARRQSRLLER